MPMSKKSGRPHHGHSRSSTPPSLPSVADLDIPQLQQQQQQQQQGTPSTKPSASKILHQSGSASKLKKHAGSTMMMESSSGSSSLQPSSFVQRFGTPLLMVTMTFLFCVALYYYNTSEGTSSASFHYRSIPSTPYRVFGPMENYGDDDSSSSHHFLEQQDFTSSSSPNLISYQEYTKKEQFAYLQQHGRQCHPNWSQRYAELQQQQQQQGGTGDYSSGRRLQVELWKYCTLFLGHGNVYMERTNLHLLPPYTLLDLIDNGDDINDNSASGVIAIQIQTPAQQQQQQQQHNGGGDSGIMDDIGRRSGGSTEKTVGLIHSSFLKVADDDRNVSLFLRSMVDVLVDTPLEILYKDPLFIEKALYTQLQQASSSAASSSSSNKDQNVNNHNKNNNDDNDEDNNNNNQKNKIPWTKWMSQCQPLVDSSRQYLRENPSVSSSSLSSKSITNQAAVSPISTKTANVRILEKTQMTLEERLYQLQADPHAPLYKPTPKPESYGLVMSCPIPQGYCCQVLGKPMSSLSSSSSGSSSSASGSMVSIMALRHPVHEPTAITATTTATHHTVTATNAVPHLDRIGGKNGNRIKSSYHEDADDIQFMSTLQEIKMPIEESQKPSVWTTPNFFDILLRNDCLPQTKACHKCLKSTKAGSCEVCKEACPCYCNVLCKVRPPPKIVSKKIYIQPPLYKKDPTRLIPRIIHQTWYEDVTPDKYPNMSRLIESWKRSGWEYNFYNDDMAADFLTKHFPPEVREAYESITPGAFKADLFRYCVLLIRGGVYADMDVLLESNLDEVITGDVGFMTPIDEPGIKVGRRSCLWNGLLAVAPGHVFMAKTIEMVVNNIRNRFTSVDYDDMLCPNPALSVSHTVDTLFTCGPCILGASINHVLKRHYQNEFEIGTVDIFKSSQDDAYDGAVTSDDLRLKIPGRTVILQQNKQDMGAHRFTLLERDLIVAATDMPDYDDRPPSVEHYSKTHEKIGIYGLKKLYTDNIRANEELQFIVV